MRIVENIQLTLFAIRQQLLHPPRGHGVAGRQVRVKLKRKHLPDLPLAGVLRLELGGGVFLFVRHRLRSALDLILVLQGGAGLAVLLFWTHVKNNNCLD